ncbi:MAG: WYL domain-containing protein [Chlorobiaceae bacterium]|nr:WYL domain-containing protein [Chlorobiaceae bacterium]
MKQSRPPLVRMQYIDQQLRENRYPNCTRVARYFEVSTKSIQRDIEYMRDQLHAPIAYKKDEKGYYYEHPGWSFLPSTMLARNEADALMATKKVLAQYQGSPYYEEVSRALDKVRQYLPESSAADEFLKIYSFEQSSHQAVDPRTFALIEDALRNKLKITLTYRASWNQEVTERTLHPYIFHYSKIRDTWYLIGHCELRNDVRTFALNRIRTISITSQHFAIPESFSIENYLDKSFDQIHDNRVYDVAIRFNPYQAQWVREHRWHPTQEIEENMDGSLTLKLKVGALEAVKRWVMRYGSEAEALEPLELRVMIKQELLMAEQLYEDVRAVKVESLSLF